VAILREKICKLTVVLRRSAAFDESVANVDTKALLVAPGK
jgi:hypothetical protein